jgi:hypothetical protein
MARRAAGTAREVSNLHGRDHDQQTDDICQVPNEYRVACDNAYQLAGLPGQALLNSIAPHVK